MPDPRWLGVVSIAKYCLGAAGCCTRLSRFLYGLLPRRRVNFMVIMRSPCWFLRFVSLLLAVLVLTASVGLTVQRLTCRISGHVVVAVSAPGRADLHGCIRAAASDQPRAKDSCCDFSKHEYKILTPTHALVAKMLVPVPLLAWAASAGAWPVSSSVVAPQSSGPTWFAANAAPPPKSGRELLAFVCTLLV